MQPLVTAATSSQFERLANVVALPIGRWDRNARLIFCNTPYLAWAGRRQEELLGGTLAALFGDAAWQAARPAFERAFEGEISSYERLLTHAPHPERWVRIQVFPEAGAGGDEFLMLARGCGHIGAPAFAEKLRFAVETAARANGAQVSASIGYANAPTDTRDPVALLQFADSAMYAAKYSGKNRVMPPVRPLPAGDS